MHCVVYQLVLHGQAINHGFHLETKWVLNALDVTDKDFVELSPLLGLYRKLDDLIRFWFEHSFLRIKLNQISIRIFRDLPFEWSLYVAEILEHDVLLCSLVECVGVPAV